jgi:hypothetical protein
MGINKQLKRWAGCHQMASVGRRCFLTLAILSIATSFAVHGQRKTRIVSANSFPGSDLGAKINAADKALGAAPGEITVKGGGTISTQVIISPDHVLRLLPGTYNSRTSSIPVLLKSRASLIGSGWQSILTESTAPGQFTVIAAYNQTIRNGSPDSGLVIRDLQIKGANPGFNSAPQAISLGNCSGCTVDKVWINGTRSIGIQLGGAAEAGQYADNSKVTNCLFTRVASQNLALVNGRNILFEGNRFESPGQAGGPGSTNIDLEPNGPGDYLENIIIRRNFIDARLSEMPTTGNGIVVQATTGTTHANHILIEDNTIIGGSNQPTVTNKLSNGIYIFGALQDVTVRNNTITRTGQAGLSIEGHNLVVEGNRLTDVGGGGIPGFRIHATNSRFVNNTYNSSGVPQPADNSIEIAAGSSGNIFQNNRNFRMPVNFR